MKKLRNTIDGLSTFTTDTLEYFINDRIVRVEKDIYGLRIYVIGINGSGSFIDKNIDKAWKERNIYNQEVFHKFLGTITVKEFLNMKYADTYEYGICDMTTGDLLYDNYDSKEEIIDAIGDLKIKTWTMKNGVLALGVESK